MLKRAILTCPLLCFMAGVLYAERPMDTDDPYVSPQGHLTVEAGNHWYGINHVPEDGNYFNFLHLELIYGLTQRTEIGISGAPGVLVYERDSRSPELGAEPLRLAVKNAGSLYFDWLRYGIEGSLNMPIETRPKFSSSRLEPMINTMAEADLGPIFLRFAAGYTYVTPFELIDDGRFLLGVAVRTNLHESNFAFTEIYAAPEPGSFGTDMPYTLALGGGVETESIGIIDAGVLWGLNEGEPSLGLRLGITLEIQLLSGE